MKISVVIPHLNQPDHLERCLSALRGGTRPPDEIFVVDNGSEALPEAVCAAHQAYLLQEREPGPGPARNRGVAASEGEILAFIDADCRADPAWLDVIARAFADPDRMVLGGDVRIDMPDAANPTCLEAYESEYAYRMDRYIAREGYTGTGNLAMRRAVFDTVGPFAGIGLAEDRDWGQRASALGFSPTYLVGMRVFHPARTDFAGLAIKWARATAHDWALARAQRFGRLKFAIKALALGVSPLAEVPRIAMSSRIPGGVSGRIAALVVLFRIRMLRAIVMLRLLAGADPNQLTAAWNREAKA